MKTRIDTIILKKESDILDVLEKNTHFSDYQNAIKELDKENALYDSIDEALNLERKKLTELKHKLESLQKTKLENDTLLQQKKSLEESIDSKGKEPLDIITLSNQIEATENDIKKTNLEIETQANLVKIKTKDLKEQKQKLHFLSSKKEKLFFNSGIGLLSDYEELIKPKTQNSFNVDSLRTQYIFDNDLLLYSMAAENASRKNILSNIEKTSFNYEEVLDNWINELITSQQRDSKKHNIDETFELIEDIDNSKTVETLEERKLDAQQRMTKQVKNTLYQGVFTNTIGFIQNNYKFYDPIQKKQIDLAYSLAPSQNPLSATSGRVDKDKFIYRINYTVPCVKNEETGIIFYLNEKDEVVSINEKELLENNGADSLVELQKSGYFKKSLMEVTLESKVKFDQDLKPQFEIDSKIEYPQDESKHPNGLIKYTGEKFPFMKIEAPLDTSNLSTFNYLGSFISSRFAQQDESKPALGFSIKNDVQAKERKFLLNYEPYKFPEIQTTKINKTKIDTFIIDKNSRDENIEKEYENLKILIAKEEKNLELAKKKKEDFEIYEKPILNTSSVFSMEKNIAEEEHEYKETLKKLDNEIKKIEKNIRNLNNNKNDLLKFTPTLCRYMLVNEKTDATESLNACVRDFKRTAYVYDIDKLILSTENPKQLSENERVDISKKTLQKWSEELLLRNQNENAKYTEENRKKIQHTLTDAMQQSTVLDATTHVLSNYNLKMEGKEYKIIDSLPIGFNGDMYVGKVSDNKFIIRSIINCQILNSKDSVHCFDKNGILISANIKDCHNVNAPMYAKKAQQFIDSQNNSHSLFSFTTDTIIEFDKKLNHSCKQVVQTEYSPELMQYTGKNYPFMYSKESNFDTKDLNKYNVNVVLDGKETNIYNKPYFPIEIKNFSPKEKEQLRNFEFQNIKKENVQFKYSQMKKELSFKEENEKEKSTKNYNEDIKFSSIQDRIKNLENVKEKDEKTKNNNPEPGTPKTTPTKKI